MLSCYAPTQAAGSVEKDDFYKQDDVWSELRGPHGFGKRNDSVGKELYFLFWQGVNPSYVALG